MLQTVFHWLGANSFFATMCGVAIVIIVLSPGVEGAGDGGGSFGGDGDGCGGD